MQKHLFTPEGGEEKKKVSTSIISSRADFLFFSPLESELDDVSFLFTDAAAAALRALPLRAELQEAADVQIVTAFVLFSSRAATDDYFFFD